jgi:hypothetical protein
MHTSDNTLIICAWPERPASLPPSVEGGHHEDDPDRAPADLYVISHLCGGLDYGKQSPTIHSFMYYMNKKLDWDAVRML